MKFACDFQFMLMSCFCHVVTLRQISVSFILSIDLMAILSKGNSLLLWFGLSFIVTWPTKYVAMLLKSIGELS